jgi:hypothetical protein
MKLVKTALQVSVATVVRQKDANLLFVGDSVETVTLKLFEYVRARLDAGEVRGAITDNAVRELIRDRDARKALYLERQAVNLYFQDHETEFLEHWGTLENIWSTVEVAR